MNTIRVSEYPDISDLVRQIVQHVIMSGKVTVIDRDGSGVEMYWQGREMYSRKIKASNEKASPL